MKKTYSNIRLYEVYPNKVNILKNHKCNHPTFGFSEEFLAIISIVEIITIFITIYNGGGFIWLPGLLIISAYFLINKLVNDNNDEKYADETALNKLNETKAEAEFYTDKFNSILAKSYEIVNQILPFFEMQAKESIIRAKIEFIENAYSPFWSEIEDASKYLACYKEALNQLCLNSEIYTFTLKKLNHNFPIPFPFTTIDFSISQSLIEEYKSIIRKAQKDPTFSIIWEQRRNSDILIGGFRTLENAINKMSDELVFAIDDLKNSISSELCRMKYIQKEHLMTYESSQAYLNKTLDSMDKKLYYIQWNKQPLGIFYHK